MDNGPILHRRAGLKTNPTIITFRRINIVRLLLDRNGKGPAAQRFGVIQLSSGQYCYLRIQNDFGKTFLDQTIVAFLTGIGGLAKKIQGLASDEVLLFNDDDRKAEFAQMTGTGESGNAASDDKYLFTG